MHMHMHMHMLHGVCTHVVCRPCAGRVHGVCRACALLMMMQAGEFESMTTDLRLASQPPLQVDSWIPPEVDPDLYKTRQPSQNYMQQNLQSVRMSVGGGISFCLWF